MISLEQQRAADALKRTKDLEKETDEFKRRYRSYIDRIGPTILMNGLGQALATELASAGENRNTEQKAHKQVYESLELWLCNNRNGVYPPNSDLLDAIMNKEESLYLHAQAEALAWLQWHKKFCRAILPADEEGDQ